MIACKVQASLASSAALHLLAKPRRIPSGNFYSRASTTDRRGCGAWWLSTVILSLTPSDATPCPSRPLHDSVVTLALALVTFTPSCFALATISTRFLDDTAWAILVDVSSWSCSSRSCRVTYSAAYVLLCIRRRSTSDGLLTTKAL